MYILIYNTNSRQGTNGMQMMHTRFIKVYNKVSIVFTFLCTTVYSDFFQFCTSVKRRSQFIKFARLICKPEYSEIFSIYRDTEMSGRKVVAKSSAPGKAILFGEQAVVHGATAIAAAVSDLRIEVDMVS